MPSRPWEALVDALACGPPRTHYLPDPSVLCQTVGMADPAGRLLSVNIGMPREVEWEGRTVHTGIWKHSVEGRRTRPPAQPGRPRRFVVELPPRQTF